MTNRFYNEAFAGTIGSTAFPSSVRDQLRNIADGFAAAQAEIDAIDADGSAAAATLRADLGGTAGADEVGYGSLTVREKLGERVNIAEFMTASQKADMNAQTLLVDCTSAFTQAHTDLTNGDVIELPSKLIRINTPLVFTKKVGIAGKNKAYATLVGVSLASDASILTYEGTTGARIQDLELKRLRFYSDNNLARGLTLTWVNKSDFSNLYFYNLYRGFVGNNAWSNNWKNVSAFGITTETGVLEDECNNNHFDRCEFRGASGLKATGSMAGLTFTQCDFEGITDTAGAGLLLAPTAGKVIRGVNVHSYFENVAGACIRCDGADADSVRALVVTGSYLFPGSAAYFSSAAGSAEYAIYLKNVNGFEISANAFEDARTAAFFRDGTERNGTVKNNTGSAVPALTSSSNQFSASVDVKNNFAGRRFEIMETMPSTGTYTLGDYVEARSPTKDGNNMMLIGWVRLVTGSAHVLGTDWGAVRVSHVTPAT